MRRLCLLTVLFLLAVPAFCQDRRDVEGFKTEITVGGWILNTSGIVQSGALAVNLESDLGVQQNQGLFNGKLVLKPRRKHRLVLEGTPYRLDGSNTLTRSITYAGKTYTVSDTITSRAEVNYFFGGYQYDVVARREGHLGILAGVAYLDTSGTITSTKAGTASESITIGLPLIGTEFRAFLIPKKNILNVNGELKGMSFGNYGRYVQSEFNLGVGLGRHVTVQAGYRIADIDVHQKDKTKGINPRFTGPVFSLQLRG